MWNLTCRYFRTYQTLRSTGYVARLNRPGGAQVNGSTTWKEGLTLTVGLPATTGLGFLFFQVGDLGNRCQLPVDEGRLSR